MSFYSFYPPSSGGSSNASVGVNGTPAPTSSTEVGGIDPSGDLQPLQTDADGNLLVSIGGGIADPLPVEDAAAEASLASIDSKTPALGQALMAASQPVVIASDQSTLPVSAASLPLPSGAATAANQTIEIAGLSSIDGKLTGVATAANQATQIANDSAFAAKSASSDVSEDYDYRAFTYVGATQNIDTIVYKTGGAGGTTVATQTFAYDGSDRLSSITKT